MSRLANNTRAVSPYAWPASLALAIFAVSSVQRVAAPSIGFNLSVDKVAHFCVFGLVATAVLRTPALKGCRKRDIICALLITSGYGALDEFRQSFTPGRSVEFDDWLADTLGALVAVLTYAKWTWYRNLLEFRVVNRKKPTEPKSDASSDL